MDKIEEIARVGRKLAMQMGWVFTIDPRKVADFRKRDAALTQSSE